MITKLIIAAIIVGLIVWDVFAGQLGQPTESSVLRDWARDWTLLPFMAGFLLTHWFAPRVNANVSGWMFAIPFMVGLTALDLYWNIKGLAPVWWRYSMLYAFLGMPVGFFLWPQPGNWSIFN